MTLAVAMATTKVNDSTEERHRQRYGETQFGETTSERSGRSTPSDVHQAKQRTLPKVMKNCRHQPKKRETPTPQRRDISRGPQNGRQAPHVRENPDAHRQAATTRNASIRLSAAILDQAHPHRHTLPDPTESYNLIARVSKR